MVSLRSIILSSWQAVCQAVTQDHTPIIKGRDKETKLLNYLAERITQNHPYIQIVGPKNQACFENWKVDLVCQYDVQKIAIEGKYKVYTDGAVPDNRKEVFFDLYKLESYVNRGEYTHGIFLWLTNQGHYWQTASGDSRDFSTHQGRIYRSGNVLTADRARRKEMPLPLQLKGNYIFEWHEVTANKKWRNLVLEYAQPNIS